jgi:hypothetical protein
LEDDSRLTVPEWNYLLPETVGLTPQSVSSKRLVRDWR